MTGWAASDRSRRPRGLCRVGVALVAAWFVAVPGELRAEISVPPSIALPDWDVAVGISGGAAFHEAGGRGATGLRLGLDVGILHDVFGLHLGVSGHREGYSHRIGGHVEVTAWYVILLGIGARFGWMTEDGGPEVPDVSQALTVLIGVPVPILRFDDGAAGALVIMPYARPGLRFDRADSVVGFHDVGIALRWTSFGY